MNTTQAYTVAVYAQDRAWGGPEEGGWWFDTGELVRVCRVFYDEDQACRFARRMNDLIDRLISPDGIGAEVHEGKAPAGYPLARPYYE